MPSGATTGPAPRYTSLEVRGNTQTYDEYWGMHGGGALWFDKGGRGNATRTHVRRAAEWMSQHQSLLNAKSIKRRGPHTAVREL